MNALQMIARCAKYQHEAGYNLSWQETTTTEASPACSVESVPPSDHGIAGANDTQTLGPDP